MKYSISNDLLDVSIKSDGAELISLKKTGDDVEYLWQADPLFWRRHAPVLFPIVGSLKNSEYSFDGKTYNLPQHGFARDSEFSLFKKKKDTISFKLKYSEESLKKYPFKFQLIIEYRLEGKKLITVYRVKNIDDQQIFFSIGAHPAFNCPLLTGTKKTDYFLELEKKETVYSLCLEKGFLSDKKALILENDNVIHLTSSTFNKGAIIIENPASHRISLKNNLTNRSITMEYTNFPYLGIWSYSKDAPFVCIEPWFGIADEVSTSGNFREKKGIQSLESGMEFICEYRIAIA
jgi:galactose mutarotase-like enzyme